jgi:endonuclease/exonuclease/phosphatase family metal-dependent hydrolase
MPASATARFTVCTYNIWTWTRWPERREALCAFVALHSPDIFCVQEVQEESHAAIDLVLHPSHDCVRGEAPGWFCEGNIWWNRSLFVAEEFGAEDIGILEEHRRLFWVRLRSIVGGGSILVSTAHWTWSGHVVARQTELNVRLPQARETVAALDRMRTDDVPQLFMGDLNDSNEPIAILRDAGFRDSFEDLGRYPDATYPARPTAQGPDQTLDWIFCRGNLQSMTSHAVDFWHGDLAASDHKPVLATYRFA